MIPAKILNGNLFLDVNLMNVTETGNNPNVTKKFQCTPYSVTCSYDYISEHIDGYLILYIFCQDCAYYSESEDRGTGCQCLDPRSRNNTHNLDKKYRVSGTHRCVLRC